MVDIFACGDFYEVFDAIEFLSQNSKWSSFDQEIEDAFKSERLAYRFMDKQIFATGNEEQANTILRTFEELEDSGKISSLSHLKKASRLLAEGEYGDSVRESISSVESSVRNLQPSSSTLGEALNLIHKSDPNKVHPALNEAFKRLYGYTSDTQGIRHSLIDRSKAPVSQKEALFMLGACSSFVSYLLN